MYSFSWNCVASVPVSTFLCLWVIYIVPGSVHIFGCSKIDRLIMEIYKSITEIWLQELGDRTLLFCFGNKEAAQCTISCMGIRKWEPDIYIGFSIRPFICSAPRSSSLGLNPDICHNFKNFKLATWANEWPTHSSLPKNTNKKINLWFDTTGIFTYSNYDV